MPTNRTSDAAARGKGRPRAFDRGLALHRALEVFWQQGYAPASVASLCKAMKINPPSLYATFGNKATLFLEALRHYEQTYWEAPAQRFLAAPATPPPDPHRAAWCVWRRPSYPPGSEA